MKTPEIDDATYPPAKHILRDLRIVVERDAEGIVGQLEIVPEILDAGGRPRLGTIATLADVVAGEIAIRAVLPNWTATSNLNVDVGDVPSRGRLEAVPRLLRTTRQTVVLEVVIRAPAQTHPVGVATLGFSILPAKSEFQTDGHWARHPEPRSEMGLATSGFTKSILESIGLQDDPETAGGIILPAVLPYHRNSLGALQGGLVAMILEAAAERYASSTLTGALRCRSLSLHFLRLGRHGPIVARASCLSRVHAGMSVRVELYDEGADNALLCVATVQVNETERAA